MGSVTEPSQMDSKVLLFSQTTKHSFSCWTTEGVLSEGFVAESTGNHAPCRSPRQLHRARYVPTLLRRNCTGVPITQKGSC